MTLTAELRVLGTVELTGVDGPQARSVLAHPKRLGLLTYLAAARGHAFHRRDELFALLWPDADTERARNSLRQAIHQIRRVLGPEAVVGRGEEEIALEASVGCDAVRFAEHLAAHDLPAALALYRGDLLAAFHVSAAPAFEEWLESERGRLRTLAAGAAWTLSREREAAGNTTEAAAWARWAAAREPLDEVAQQRLIAALDHLGDRAGALGAYDAFAARLRSEYDAEPAAETQALIAGVRARSATLAPLMRHGPALAPDIATEPARPETATEPPRHRRWAWLAYVAGALTVLAIAAIWGRSLPRAAKLVDPHLAVIAPFHVSGADSSLAFLREGMLDLLAAKLSGAGGLRVADPRTSVTAWRSTAAGEPTDLPDGEALALARAIGGGQLLLGSVVGRNERLTLTAQLLDTRRGEVRARADVEGVLDSLPTLVDRMVARLLSENAEEPAPRLASLTSTSLPALKAYLLGRSAFRRGRYGDAVRQLQEAVDLDSSFAIAWLELVRVSDWSPYGIQDPGRSAWAVRERLGRADRADLEALLGTRYPRPITVRDRLDGWANAVRLSPERPDDWYALGDSYFHQGQLTGRDSGYVRAEAAFARAVALDSSFAAPLEHLVQIALLRGDLRATRRLAELYATRDPSSDAGTYLTWRAALALGDSATARSIEAALDTLPMGVLSRIVEWAQLDGVGVPTAWRAVHVLRQRAGGAEADYAARLFGTLATNTGRFVELTGHTPNFPAKDSLANWFQAAVSLDGDPALGRAALAHADDPSWPSARGLASCLRLEWALASPVQPPDTSGLGALFGACAQRHPAPATMLALRALYAARSADPALPARLAELDSARLDAAISGTASWYSYLEGQALMARAEFARARDAFRRRELAGGYAGLRWASMLRLEGRAAELAGDTAGAVRAYRHYLALRYDPDPGVRAYADSVRAALARLDGRGGRR